jgi:hypothetical protein
MTVRVLVYGGRNYADAARLFHILDHYHAESGGFSAVIEGEASGVDKLARAWAESRGVPFDPYPADWDNLDAFPFVLRRRADGKIYNAAAGGIRNERMLVEGKPDVGIEFPGGTGTADMSRRLRLAKVPVVCVS